MMQDQTPYAWKTVGLAVLPGMIYLVTPLIATLFHYRWSVQTFWILEIPTLSAALVVIAVGWMHEKRLPLWSLFAVGLTAFVLLEGGTRTNAIVHADQDQFTRWYTFLSLLALLVAGGILLGGAFVARRYGAAAALLAAGLKGTFVVELFDPTSGLLIIAADRFSLPGVRLIELIGKIPLLIVLPVTVLRARSERRQVGALLGGYGLSLLVLLLLSLLHDFALQGVSGGSPFPERTLNLFLIRPVILAIPWVILVLVTLLYSRLKRDEAPDGYA